MQKKQLEEHVSADWRRGVSVQGWILTPLKPKYEANSPALLREFENKASSNNRSVKKVSTEYFTTTYNKKLKFTGLLTDAGKRSDSWLSSFDFLRRWSILPDEILDGKVPNEYKTKLKWPEQYEDLRSFYGRKIELLLVVRRLELSADWSYDPSYGFMIVTSVLVIRTTPWKCHKYLTYKNLVSLFFRKVCFFNFNCSIL